MALVPPSVVTVTSTVPTPAGEVAVIWVALSTVKEPAALLPNLTAVTPEKLVPVMVTLVPPDVGPVFGLTLVTVGGPNCELRLRGRLHIGEQQKRRRPTAHRRAVAARVLATQPHMPQNPLRAPCACPELTRTPTPRTSWKSALSPLCRVPRPLRPCRHPRTPPHLETRALASGRSVKPSRDIGDNRAESVLLCSVTISPRSAPLALDYRNCVGRGPVHLGGAGTADEWWSTIFQSLPSFT